MSKVTIHSPTYHHFVGNGESDSFLNKIFFPNDSISSVRFFKHLCKFDEAFIDSFYDILLTKLAIPVHGDVKNNNETNIVAPKLPNNRHRILWTDEGIADYQNVVVPHLGRTSLLQSLARHLYLNLLIRSCRFLPKLQTDLETSHVQFP